MLKPEGVTGGFGEAALPCDSKRVHKQSIARCAKAIAALARRISSSSSAVSVASVGPMKTRFRLPVNLSGTW